VSFLFLGTSKVASRSLVLRQAAQQHCPTDRSLAFILKVTLSPLGAGYRPNPRNRTPAFRTQCCEPHRDGPRRRNWPIALERHRHLKRRDKRPILFARDRARPTRSDELIRLPAGRSRIPCHARKPGPQSRVDDIGPEPPANPARAHRGNVLEHNLGRHAAFSLLFSSIAGWLDEFQCTRPPPCHPRPRMQSAWCAAGCDRSRRSRTELY
jgi:hypothetical protein